MSDDTTGEKTGLSTAVGELHDRDSVPPGADVSEQQSLFALSKIDDGDEAGKRGVPSGRGKGRPPGAKNKSTEAWREFLLSRYPSPLQGLAEIAHRPVQDVARELGCSRLEAFKIQVAALKELAPYIHSKMPQAIDMGDGGLLNLTINTGQSGPVADKNPDAMDVEFIDLESEQNQELSDSESENSNNEYSNENAESDGGGGIDDF